MSALTHTETITYNILRTDSVTGEMVSRAHYGEGLTLEEVVEIARNEPKRPSWRGNSVVVRVTAQRAILTEEVAAVI